MVSHFERPFFLFLLMKYTRLTKEQFNELHTEFSTFLATQKIDKREWDQLKLQNPEIAEQELDLFSDLVWERVLRKVQYLEHFSKNHIFLFECFEKEIKSIILKSFDSKVNFLTKEGLQYLSDSLFTEKIDLKIGTKLFSEDKNLDLFQLIQQGAIISDGQLYKQIDTIINK